MKQQIPRFRLKYIHTKLHKLSYKHEITVPKDTFESTVETYTWNVQNVNPLRNIPWRSKQDGGPNTPRGIKISSAPPPPLSSFFSSFLESSISSITMKSFDRTKRKQTKRNKKKKIRSRSNRKDVFQFFISDKKEKRNKKKKKDRK